MSQGFTRGVPIDTDVNLTANSDLLVPSQKAVKAYITGAINNIPDATNTLRGLVSIGTQTFGGSKTFTSAPTFSTLTLGSVLFAGTGGLLSESNLDFYWDNTNKRLRVGNSVTSSFTTTPPRLLTLYQTLNNHSVLLCGQEYTDPVTYPVSTMDGILFTLGVNRPGNRQLWIGDSTALGNTGTGTSAKAFFRYLTGGPLPSIDGIRGDGGIRLPVNIGTNTTNTAIGFEWTGVTGTTLPQSRLTIYGNLSVGNTYISTAAPTNGASIEGNVIIGTSTDSGYKLDINGTVRTQGKLTLGSSIIASGASEGTSGQVLTSNGVGAAPSWSTISGSGITTLNTLTATTQTFATGTSGTDFNISSSTSTHTFNIPTSSATNRGLLSSANWTTFNSKQDAITLTTTGTSGAATLTGSTLNIPQYSGGGSSYTFSTGLTNSSGTVTSNLSTGISGGQSVIGGTASGNSLTLSSTSNATKGNILFGTSSYDEVNNRLGIGTTSPNSSLHVVGSQTASTNIARGSYFKPTLTAVSNSDNLVSLDIEPTFTLGAFTSAKRLFMRMVGGLQVGLNTGGTSLEIQSLISNVDFLGISGNTGTFNFYGGGAYNSGAGIVLTGSSNSSIGANIIRFYNGAFTARGQISAAGNWNLGTSTTDAGYKLDVGGTTRLQGNVTISDTYNLSLGSTTGTKIGTSNTEKLGFWNVTPIVQPTTSVTSATRVGGAGTTITTTDTFDGYTLAQVVKALRNSGLLA